MNARFYAVLAAITGVSATGCAIQKPALLGACLDDPAIISAYDSFQSAEHGNFLTDGRAYLVGGYNETTNTVSCYWQTHNLTADVFRPNSNPIGQCMVNGNRYCTILMNGPERVFRATDSNDAPDDAVVGDARQLERTRRSQSESLSANTGQTDLPGSGGGLQVVLHLLGAFAEGMAQGVADYYANPRVQAVVIRQRPAWDDERPLRCMRDAMPGPNGYGFTCRR